jgi:hypothetical protein
MPYAAPPGSVPPGEVYRSFVSGAPDPSGDFLSVPDITLFATDQNNTVRFPQIGTVITNLRGEFTIPGVLPVPDSDRVDFSCAAGLTSALGDCNGQFLSEVTPNQANTDYIDRLGAPYPNTDGIASLADGSPCGTVNEFFGVSSTGTASLLDGSSNVIGSPVRLSHLGAYALPYDPTATRVLLTCENAAPQYVSITGPGTVAPAMFPATAQPFITNMTAMLDGAPVGIFLPTLSLVSSEPSLSYKGSDSRADACAYYQAIGAAHGCHTRGTLRQPITFDDWMRTVQIGKYAPPTAPAEFTANYINRADLNLARNHHSISYGTNHTAAYVCNHLGPNEFDPPQAEIDTVVDNIVANKNLVACVAMDYMASPGVNGGQPFVRFLIFGPNGQLLPSVDLDGQGEKFVPGTCVACHGGDHYASHFSARPAADLGAHFLPYDTGNFEFSSKPGLTEADQEEAIYNLNQNVLNVNPNVAEQEVIAGWYAAGHTLDKSYVPSSWQGRGSAAVSFYQNVVARSCRGCHVATVEGYNWDHYANIDITQYRGTANYDLAFTIGCNSASANTVFRGNSMPNSLVTFGRFWDSAGTAVDQPAITNAFLSGLGDGYLVEPYCVP